MLNSHKIILKRKISMEKKTQINKSIRMRTCNIVCMASHPKNLQHTLSSKVTYWHNLNIAWLKQKSSNGSTMSRLPHNTVELKAIAKVCKFEHLSLIYRPQSFMWTQFLKDLFHSHGSPIHIMGLKQPNNDMFGFPPNGGKKTTIAKTLQPPFAIQRLKMHVANKHLTKVDCTYVVKVFFTNVARTF